MQSFNLSKRQDTIKAQRTVVPITQLLPNRERERERLLFVILKSFSFLHAHRNTHTMYICMYVYGLWALANVDETINFTRSDEKKP